MLKKLLTVLINDPLRIPSYLWTKIFILSISFKSNIQIKGKIIINGTPIIDIRKGAKLVIGNNVTLTSRNIGLWTICNHRVVAKSANFVEQVTKWRENLAKTDPGRLFS